MSGQGNRPLLRLARRAIRKAPLRSVLVVVLIAVMVAVGSMVATIARTNRVTAQDIVARELGSADVVISVPLQPGENPWGIFSRAGGQSVGGCSTTYGPDGSQTTICGDRVPTAVPVCVPGAPCVDGEVTPAQQQYLDEFAEWRDRFDPEVAADTLRSSFGADVEVIQEASSFSRSGRSSPFLRGRSIEALAVVDVAAPINRSSIRIVSGRAPQAATEIALAGQDTASTVAIDGIEYDVVGRVARAGFGGGSFWGVVTEQGLSRSAIEPSVVRFRLDGLGRLGAPQLGELVRRASAVAGQPAYAFSDAFVASPSGEPDTWFVDERDDDWIQPSTLPSAIGSTMLTLLLGVQVVLVAATVFTVGFRRRSREFSQLLTVGADARHVRKLAIFEGLLLGVLGAAGGVVLGLIFASVGANQGWWGTSNAFEGGVRFSPVDWIGPVLAGVLAAGVAAWWPMRGIADEPLTSPAFTNAPSARPHPFVPRTGLVLVIVGILGLASLSFGAQSMYGATPLLAVVAVLAAFVGLLLLIGTLLSWFGRRADGLPALARLVVRNADRHRSRSWLVVGSFILAIGIPVAIGAAIKAYPASFGGERFQQDEATVVLSQRAPWGGSYLADVSDLSEEEREAFARRAGFDLDDLDRAEQGLVDFVDDFTASVSDVLGPVEVAPLVAVDGVEMMPMAGRDSYAISGFSHVGIATPELVSFLGLSQGDQDQLARGVALSVLPVPEGEQASVVNWGARTSQVNQFPVPSQQVRPTLLDVVYIGDRVLTPAGGTISLIVSPDVADEFAASFVEVGTLFRAQRPVTEAGVDTLRAAAHTSWTASFGDNPAEFAYASGVGLSTAVDSRLSPTSTSPSMVRLIVALIATAIAAMLAFLTSALIALESEREIGSMIAVGARPAIRRQLLGAQTLYYLAMAAILAVPTTLVLYRIAAQADDFGPRGFLVVPWLSILLSAVVMPIVVAGLIVVFFRNGKPAVSRRLT
jgi:putative ABC transport system permease protein